MFFWGFFLRLTLLFISASHPDIGNHLDWGNRFLDLGPAKFYENIFWNVSWPNQPLGSILLFGSTAFIKDILFNSLAFLNQNIPIFPSFIIPILEKNLHIWLVKLPFLLADLGLAFLIYQIVHQHRPKYARLATALFLFNPLVIYNSTIWGQTDSLVNLLALTGIYLTYRRHYSLGIILFLSGFLFKLSLIIYLPLYAILLLKRLSDWQKFILPLFIFLLLVFLLALPFTFGDKNSFQWLWYLYTNRVLPRQGSMLNGNAFNLWFLIFGLDFSKSEFITLGPFSYQFWSRLAFVISLIPIIIKTLKNKLTLTRLLSSLLLSAFGAFLLLTNMHERYLYPIFPIFTILLFLSPKIFKFKDYLILSLLHLLNLYHLWFYPRLPLLPNLLQLSNYLLPKFFSLVFMIIYAKYWLKYLKNE